MLTTLGAIATYAAAVTFFSMVIPRVPKVLAWRRQHWEQRILAGRKNAPSAQPRTVFYTGLVPRHEACAVLPSEETDFAKITSQLDYAWIRDALKGAEMAREQQ